jgi:hypothetical protein
MDAPRPSVEVISGFRGPRHASLPGESRVLHRFEALEDGIRLTKRVTSDGTAEVRELWATIPVYSGEGRRARGIDPTDGDTRIEYRDGGEWKPMTASPVTTDRIRLGKIHGGETNYGYVVFETPQRVRLSSEVWEATYQTSTRLRNILIDLHPDSGTVRPMPRRVSVTYALRTRE